MATLSHPAHLEHKLTLEATKKFKCDGCRQQGAGERYWCQTCDFELHKQCALDEGTRIVHPLLKNIELELRYQVPAGTKDGSRLVCDGCSNGVLGFHYHSSKLCLHPCCAVVSTPVDKEKEKEKEIEEEKEKEKVKEDGCGRDQGSRRSSLGGLCKMIGPASIALVVAGVTGDATPILDLFSNCTV